MIKLCLDSNIFISALLFDGKPEEILFVASKGEIKIIISPSIIEEVRKNLIEKFNRSDGWVKKMLKATTSISQLVDPKITVRKLRYLPDNKILSAALAGKADYIVTGDRKHLLPLKEFRGIPIITPAQFLAILK